MPIRLTQGRVMNSMIGPMDGDIVQETWPGRFCDICRNLQVRPPKLATHKRDSEGGGSDMYCDDHLPEEENGRTVSSD